jgi:malonyl-CoA O-methyltransferase
MMHTDHAANHEESAIELSPLAGYTAWAPCYDDDGNPLIALEAEAVRDLVGPLDGKTVLDLGCGTGRHTLALAQGGAWVAAVDQCLAMMSAARRKLAGFPVVWARLSLPARLPFRAGTFDPIVMGLVAEHLADLSSVIRESAAVIRLGGRLVVSALHPDRTAEGQRARFIDPETGLRRPISTVHRTKEDYRANIEPEGWSLIEERDLIVHAGLVSSHPRAARYVGLPLGWVGCWLRDC